MESILVIDDNDTMREGVVAVCERLGHAVKEAPSGVLGLKMIEEQSFDLVITDLKMDGIDGIGVIKGVKEKSPDTVVILITGHASIETAVAAGREGVFDYIEKPFPPDALRLKINNALGSSRDKAKLREALRPQETALIGDSAATERIKRLVDKVASSNTNVHIYGESGTGKEIVATLIHQGSARANAPLIKVNCGAIPETL